MGFPSVSLSLLLVGCAQPNEWVVSVRFPPDQDPLEGADRLEVVVESDRGASRRSLDPGAQRLEFPISDPDRTLERIEISAFFGPDRTAFGRGGPYRPRSDDAPEPIYFARVRLFASTVDAPPAGGGYALATDGGAWVATGAGLSRYEHATGRFVEGPVLTGASAARFAALPDGRLAAFVGTDAFVSEDRLTFTQVASGLPDATQGTVVGFRDGVVVAGPSMVWTWAPDAPGEPRVVVAVDPPRAFATATILQEGDTPRAVVAGGVDAGGNPLDEVLVVDLDASAVVGRAALATARFAHAAIEVPELRGHVWLFGGTTAAGATDTVEAVIVGSDGRASIRDPAPEPLFRPRTGTSAIGLPGGDILLCGGATTPPQDAILAERFRLKGGGTSVLTDPLPEPISGAAATTLADGSILVSGDGSAAIYVPDPE